MTSNRGRVVEIEFNDDRTLRQLKITESDGLSRTWTSGEQDHTRITKVRMDQSAVEVHVYQPPPETRSVKRPERPGKA